MQTTPKPTQSTPRGWTPAVVRPGKEFPLTPLSILSGTVPPGLRGTLYRNGPGRLERGDEKVGHWFDGDGAVLAVHFTDAGVTGTYRYIQTTGYVEESEANRYLYANYGMKDPTPIWNFWWRVLTQDTPLKNTGNTSVMALGDRLLALWEAGKPYALDLQTLATFGTDDLAGLDFKQHYAAHPKVDPVTGEIYNTGVTMGVSNTLYLYKSDPTGKVLQKGSVEIGNVPFVHSFVLAGQYLVFCIPPIGLDNGAVFLKQSSYSEALQWKPEEGTDVIVVDRETLEVISRSKTEPFFQWHFGNGCVDEEGIISLEVVRYPDFPQSNQYLREMATGSTRTPAKGTLWQMRIDPQTAQVKNATEVIQRDCEFPVVPPAQVGQPWRYTYVAIHRDEGEVGREWYDAVARYDYETNTLTEADFGEHRYVVEPLYAQDQGDSEQGWILTVVYDGEQDHSEVWIFDSDHLDEEPVCRLGLPEVIPIGFHGTWKAH